MPRQQVRTAATCRIGWRSGCQPEMAAAPDTEAGAGAGLSGRSHLFLWDRLVSNSGLCEPFSSLRACPRAIRGLPGPEGGRSSPVTETGAGKGRAVLSFLDCTIQSLTTKNRFAASLVFPCPVFTTELKHTHPLSS